LHFLIEGIVPFLLFYRGVTVALKRLFFTLSIFFFIGFFLFCGALPEKDQSTNQSGDISKIHPSQTDDAPPPDPVPPPPPPLPPDNGGGQQDPGIKRMTWGDLQKIYKPKR
jgi:hypothetical protein